MTLRATPEVVHRAEKTIRVPQVGEPYWQTACGIRFAGDVERITTSDDPKGVTCSKCKGGKTRLKAVR